jgi:hypothetical protein
MAELLWRQSAGDSWGQAECPLLGTWISKMWQSHSMELNAEARNKKLNFRLQFKSVK